MKQNESMRRAARAALCGGAAFTLAAAGCGGRSSFDDPGYQLGEGGSGGSGGAPTTTSTTTTSTTSTVTTTSTSTTTTSTSTTTTTGEGGAPSIPALVEVNLGQVPFGTPVSFEIPPGLLGFTAVARVEDDLGSYDFLGTESLVAPDGTPVIESYTLGPTTLSYYLNYGIQAASVPQTDAAQAMPVAPGKWTITLGSDVYPGPDKAQLSIWERQTVDGAFHGGVIDANVFITEGVSDPSFMKSVLQKAYSNYAGLTLGTVNFYGISSDFTVIDENNFYTAFEQTWPATTKPALNIIVVGAFSGQLEGAAGVTPGAPAVPVIHGSHLSGIVVTVDNGVFDTVVLQHEAGHFAGLYHTSEFEPGYGDRLTDTPLCADVNSFYEDCPDFSNLMFPTGGDGSLALSPRQLRVIQSSTLYRGIVEAGGAAAVPLPPPAPVAEAIAANVPWLGSFSGGGAVAPWLPPPPAAGQAWAAGLSHQAAALLSGMACTTGTMAPAAFAELLRALAPLSAKRLVQLGRDGSAPVQVRKRALQVLARRSLSPATAAALSAIAFDAAVPRAVRIGAVRGLAAAAKGTRRTLRSRLAAGPDAVLTRTALRLLAD